ncbi:MAG TPA: serine/threonine-protein kinase, partial [Kofleriaceae bacterium]|nr:serine/threonine-protein kinase [Kofleriaceae bacterium]
MDLAAGDLFDGRYRIVARLGEGARGVVYRALDLAVEPEQADVCLKLLHREAVRAGEGEALRLGFGLLARLHHPNLVGVRRHGTAYGVPYLVSELVDGVPLDRAIAGQPAGELLPLAAGVARALAYLHGNGHVHQDVKPSNVLVANVREPDIRAWRPRLADLGATHLPGTDRSEPARSTTGLRRLTGTLEYLSPERLRGGPADPRADLWALGVTLFACAAGRLPVDARRPDELLRRIEAGQIPPLRDAVPDAPAELERVVAWLLAIDPRERPADGGEALAVLERAVGLHDDTLASRTEPAALVGRDRAIARVLTTFGPRATPAPRTVLLAAPAGAGRSRFLDEIAIRAQLAGGRAARVPAGTGLLPWRQALVALGDDPSPDIAADELAERLATSAVVAPTVIVVDDLDRRDRLAHELVDRVAQSLAGRPCGERSGVLVAAGAGATPRDPSVAVAVALLPLDEPAIRDLAASMLAGEPPPALPALLHRDSGGSPARVVQALQHLLAVGALRRLGGRWDLDGDAAEILGTDGPGDRQLAGLDGAAREVLAALALFGPGAQVPLVVLHRVVGGDEDATLAAAQQACAAQLVRVGPDDDGHGLVLEHRGERVRA